MTSAEALREIRRLASTPHRVVITRHAAARMAQRGVHKADVCNACVTSETITWQDDHRSWKATGGVDLDGDSLDVRLNIEADLIIRTVF